MQKTVHLRWDEFNTTIDGLTNCFPHLKIYVFINKLPKLKQ